MSDLTGNLVRLLNNLLTLGQDELDVAGVRHVRVDLRLSWLEMNTIDTIHRVAENIHDREHGMCVFAAWGPG